MLKVTIPHLGNSYIPLSALFREVGLEVILPPPISQETIALGAKLAPEFACLPFKINLGNFVETLRSQTIDLIFMAGGVGPCRFGYYGQLQQEILRANGYQVDFLILEAPKTHPRELWEKLKKYLPKHRLTDFSRALSYAWQKAKAVDTFDTLANQIRPLEKKPGATSRLQKKFYHALNAAVLHKDIKKIVNNALQELSSLSVKTEFKPLKIVLLGEIYMVLESQVNFKIEETLGNMGVEVKRTIHFSEWVFEHLLLSIVKPNWRQKQFLLAKSYLDNFVGGHGLETVAHTVDAAVNNYHGVVELAPFTCMPEIVAMQALPAITKDLGIPVLPLIIDEHSGEAGIRTRLEAFVDMLAYRRSRSRGGELLEVVSRN